MSTFLIVGATGKQGGKAISTLLDHQANDKSLSLRFITRNPDSASARKLVNQGAQAFKADLFDKDSLRQALTGVDRAFLVTDAMVGEEKEIQQGKTFIDIAKEVGVQHIVFTSVSAADTANTVPHFRSKYQIEKHLHASGLTYTILRPVAFMDNFPAGPGIARFMIIGLFFAAAGSKPVDFIATEDIGLFAAKSLLKPDDTSFNNKTINLSAGSYDINSVSRAIEKAQGHTPWLARYTPTFIRSILPHDFKAMFTFFDETGYPDTDVAALRQIHPDLLSFEDWFKKNAPK